MDSLRLRESAAPHTGDISEMLGAIGEMLSVIRRSIVDETPQAEPAVEPAAQPEASRPVEVASRLEIPMLVAVPSPIRTQPPVEQVAEVNAPVPFPSFAQLHTAPQPVEPPVVKSEPVQLKLAGDLHSMEPALRAALREMILEELHGEMGARFTANIRSLIRREMAAAVEAHLDPL